MRKMPWDIFFNKSLTACLRPGTDVLDIGAGLRVDATREGGEDPQRSWIKPLLGHLSYKVLDVTPKYHPDIVGDVMKMPLPDASWDAVICLAVLEHVPRPWDAMNEIYRVLKPGGMAFLYVPFLSPYHSQPGYYGDYFHMTEDGIRSLCERFSSIELCAVRGPIETLTHLLPGKFGHSFVRHFGRFLDQFRHASGKQASGYFFLIRK